MLEHSFCHVRGVGPATERRFWALGFHAWGSFLDAEAVPGIARNLVFLRETLEQSVRMLRSGNAAWFAERLPPDQHWRIFGEFRERTAYLDIETTGTGCPGDHITAIALYDGETIRHYVHGMNLNEFRHDIKGVRVLVTYNGKAFDVPFIERELGLRLDVAHIDLMHVLRRLGFRGGLKGCEKQLGLDRGELDGLDGYAAVLLWRDWKRTGDRRFLETLLAYNVQDAVNLEVLMTRAYNMNISRTPFADGARLDVPALPSNPFRAHASALASIRREKPPAAVFRELFLDPYPENLW